MNLRKITSLTAILAFFHLMFTSVVLYIVPPGRVAYWSDWHFLGLSKTEWGNQHILVGFLFLLTMFIHIWLNWKPIVNYMKAGTKSVRVFNGNFVISFFIVAIFSSGVWLSLPPFQWLIDAGEIIKDNGALKYGEPPYGHAELSTFTIFCKRVGIAEAAAIGSLRKYGITVTDTNSRMIDIAQKSRVTPQKLYFLMQDKTSSNEVNLPTGNLPGFGKLSVGQFVSRYQLNEEFVLRFLNAKGKKYTVDSLFKGIAEEQQISAQDLYHQLREQLQN